MAKQNRQSAIGNRQLKRLVPLLLDWFSANARDLPWRRTCNPYAIWVSEIMLQQTQVKTVMPYWERWMRELPTVGAVANVSSDKIHKLWEGLGYYTRARNLQKAAKQIMEKHGGKFPRNFNGLLALPGVGRYTAGAICSIAFNQPTPILDGNVIRVLTRIFGIGENPKEKTTNARLWRLAEELVIHASAFAALRRDKSRITHHASRPLSRTSRLRYTSPRQGTRTMDEGESDATCSHLNQSLMELGALVCTPRNPQCKICPVKKLCVAFRRKRVEELPNLGKRAMATARHFIAFIVKQNGRFLVCQRPAGVVNAHLWEFPNVEILNGKFNPKLTAKNVLGVEPPRIKPFCTLKHSITRYRITLEVFATRLNKVSEKTSGAWRTPTQMQGLAFTSAHRKVLCALTTRAGR